MFEGFALERIDTGEAEVCPDLRGYGESAKPPTTPDHSPYSKRAMAGDCAALMKILGHERFCVAGQGHGARVTGPTTSAGNRSTAATTSPRRPRPNWPAC